jgi:ketosteroid isomerase-like protein
MKKFFLLLALFFSLVAFSQSGDARSIRKVLDDQVKAWNNGDIETFMQGYWKNDSLMFIGKSGINWGWQQTLENYKKRYPDKTAMGKLSFDIILIKELCPEYYYVVGKWMLKRTIGDLSGHYNLLFRNMKGRWLIIADHSS